MLLRLESVEAERDRMFVEHRALTSTALSLVDTHMKTMIRSLSEEEGIDALAKAGYKPSDIVRLVKEIEKADRDLTLQRFENAKDAQERHERLVETHAEELAAMYRELVDELDLTPEQLEIAKAVAQRQLDGEPAEEKVPA
jgi:DNA-binding MarR family transcriptional regulator